MARRHSGDQGAVSLETPELNGENPLAGLLAEVKVMLGQMGERMERQDGLRKPVIPWNACHPAPLEPPQMSLSAGAGTLDVPDMMGPHDPYWWDIRRITASGFTAGSVTLRLNDANGLIIDTISSQNVPFLVGAQFLLPPRSRLVVTATGITGTVTVSGQIVEVESSWLPEYLI